MNSKKAFELSMNFIVILIISMIIFVGGIFFTNKFLGLATETKERIDRETELEIQQLVNDGNRVAIPFQTKTIKKGASDVFGLGIMNIHRTKKAFYVSMSFSKSYFVNNSPMIDPDSDYINENWIFSDPREFQIVPNTYASVPILVNVKSKVSDIAGTTKGTYVFDVCVCDADPCACPAAAADLYDGYLHKLYVEVP